MSLIDDVKDDPSNLYLHDAFEIAAALLAAEELAAAVEAAAAEYESGRLWYATIAYRKATGADE